MCKDSRHELAVPDVAVVQDGGEDPCSMLAHRHMINSH